MSRSRNPSVPAEAPPAAPAAERTGKPGWRDPRLAIGVALVALSVVIGARLVGGSDDTVEVWALARPVEAGQSVSVDDLEPLRVRFADQDLADRYLPATSDLPEGAALDRAVGAGELLPRNAVTDRSRGDLIEVPLSVATGSLPPGLAVGATVDVWVLPPDATGEGARDRRARRHLDEATVLAVGKEAGALSVSGERGLLVGVPAAEEDKVAELLGGLAQGRVVITRRS